MSDTPRTDANYVCHYGDGLGQWVPREFACDLERELAAAQKDAERYRYLKSVMTVPHAMQSWLKFNNFNPDTPNMGIDESIDAAMKECKK